MLTLADTDANGLQTHFVGVGVDVGQYEHSITLSLSHHLKVERCYLKPDTALNHHWDMDLEQLGCLILFGNLYISPLRSVYTE